MTTLLQQAIDLAKSGERAQAEVILQQVLADQPNNEVAWMWLSGVTRDRTTKRIALEKALALNPDNVLAEKGLRRFSASTTAPPATFPTSTSSKSSDMPEAELTSPPPPQPPPAADTEPAFDFGDDAPFSFDTFDTPTTDEAETSTSDQPQRAMTDQGAAVETSEEIGFDFSGEFPFSFDEAPASPTLADQEPPPVDMDTMDTGAAIDTSNTANTADQVEAAPFSFSFDETSADEVPAASADPTAEASDEGSFNWDDASSFDAPFDFEAETGSSPFAADTDTISTDDDPFSFITAGTETEGTETVTETPLEAVDAFNWGDDAPFSFDFDETPTTDQADTAAMGINLDPSDSGESPAETADDLPFDWDSPPTFDFETDLAAPASEPETAAEEETAVDLADQLAPVGEAEISLTLDEEETEETLKEADGMRAADAIAMARQRQQRQQRMLIVGAMFFVLAILSLIGFSLFDRYVGRYAILSIPAQAERAASRPSNGQATMNFNGYPGVKAQIKWTRNNEAETCSKPGTGLLIDFQTGDSRTISNQSCLENKCVYDLPSDLSGVPITEVIVTYQCGADATVTLFQSANVESE